MSFLFKEIEKYIQHNTARWTVIVGPEMARVKQTLKYRCFKAKREHSPPGAEKKHSPQRHDYCIFFPQKLQMERSLLYWSTYFISVCFNSHLKFLFKVTRSVPSSPEIIYLSQVGNESLHMFVSLYYLARPSPLFILSSLLSLTLRGLKYLHQLTFCTLSS